MIPYGQSKKTGQVPGSLLYTGEASDRPITISVLEYDEKEVSSHDNVSTAEAFDFFFASFSAGYQV